MALQFAAQLGLAGRNLCGIRYACQGFLEELQLAGHELLVEFGEMRFAGAVEDDPGDQRYRGGAGGEQQAQARGEGRLHASRSSST
ncbi:hypothetical protein FQZ97_1250770 [compost metagenome]